MWLNPDAPVAPYSGCIPETGYSYNTQPSPAYTPPLDIHSRYSPPLYNQYYAQNQSYLPPVPSLVPGEEFQFHPTDSVLDTFFHLLLRHSPLIHHLQVLDVQREVQPM